jgi:D-alanyl-D-alanine carboxypeptidase/D-alanyl-D-alanine-endopeptidase (penicillin-binding protein 4)
MAPAVRMRLRRQLAWLSGSGDPGFGKLVTLATPGVPWCDGRAGRVPPPRTRARGVVTLAAAVLAAAPTPPAWGAAAEPALVWYAESADGAALAARRADDPVNPASVVKLATTLAALERLGPDHRFTTRVAIHGALDADSGTVAGDLVVEGGGDPDFQVENAFLVAEALRAQGVRRVDGAVLVGPTFWIGWEGGSARRSADAAVRARLMASRFREALDPARWTAETAAAWRESAARRGRSLTPPPGIAVRGTAPAAPAGAPMRALVVHRSNPLARTLKRLNAWSNNDIERLEASLGSPRALAAWLVTRLGVPAADVALETLSGLGTNRVTPRVLVRLVGALAAASTARGLALEDLVPMAGCDPGTLVRFPALTRELARALAAKTGTLGVTDGGVTALAGVAYAAEGPLTFVVASPGAGGRLDAARRGEERFVVDLVRRHGGPAARRCGAGAGWSDDEVLVEAVD